MLLMRYYLDPANYLQGPAYSLGPGPAADPEDPAVIIWKQRELHEQFKIHQYIKQVSSRKSQEKV